MTFSAWFDSLSVGAKIGVSFLIVLAAAGAAAGFVASIARVARLAMHLFGKGRTRDDRHGGPGET